jgi:two-component system, LytTR family, response regulator
LVKADFKTIKVIFNEIIYIEALQKYVRIHMENQRIVTLMSMSQLEETLPKNQFIRIHRSFIVNLDKIQTVDGNLIIIDKHNIPISKSQKEEFVNWVNSKGKG